MTGRGIIETLVQKPTTIPEVAYCAEKQRLLEEFTDAMRELVSLQQLQIRAVIDDDPDFARFDILISSLAEKKRQAKYAYMDHVHAHGC